MNELPHQGHQLARHLVEQETGSEPGAEQGISPALRAVEKLRAPLSRLAGTSGYRALLMRALALSGAHAPCLNHLRVEPDASVHWVDARPLTETPDEAAEGGVALLAELIGLLIVFIGEGLTLQMLRLQWPNKIPVATDMVQKETLR